ncbi:hypothetical protein K440DRAFT_626698 [Wilcoxina mikolae CBS 423.85]|nr:hypothetical protein K440DRAFT_626698 [Wilcoxina mikolae CBS 423.85]
MRNEHVEIDRENLNVPLLGTLPPVETVPPSIFVKTTVSPWPWITHPVILAIRLVVSIGIAFLVIHFATESQNGNPRLFPFLLGNLTWYGQCFYMWMAFVSFPRYMPVEY